MKNRQSLTLLEYLDNPKKGEVYRREIIGLHMNEITQQKLQDIRDKIDKDKTNDSKIVKITKETERKKNTMKKAQTLKEFFSE